MYAIHHWSSGTGDNFPKIDQTFIRRCYEAVMASANRSDRAKVTGNADLNFVGDSPYTLRRRPGLPWTSDSSKISPFVDSASAIFVTNAKNHVVSRTDPSSPK
ncbi:hypothetical protein HK102_001556 [Quaeritorhiza haematococci]|nr:hypothetical protein HK102_001556 [Quaeritorhiza haematococci]